MKEHFFVKHELNKPQKYQWIGLLLILFCLIGCETYQHENLKVGQSKTAAIDLSERYVDTDIVIKRLESRGTKIQLDSLLQLAELLSNTDAATALIYAQEGYRVATINGQEVSEAISLYYITLLKSRQQIFGEGLEDIIVDAKLSNRFFEKSKNIDWQINSYHHLGGLYYQKSEKDSALFYLRKSEKSLTTANFSKNRLYNLRGELYHNFANIYSTTDTTKANFYYNESFALYDSTQNRIGQNRLKVAIGYYHLYDLGDLKSAERMFQQSLAYAESFKDTKILIESYQGLAYLKIEQFVANKDEKHFMEALGYLKKQLSLQKENFYFTYELMGYLYREKFNSNTLPKSTIANLDSAIVNYKKAVFYAQKEGAIETMETLGNNISKLCALRNKRFNISCDSLFGNSPTNFLYESYNGIVKNITKNLEVANKKIRKYEKREQEVIHQQRISRNWLITFLSLGFFVLIFLLVLQRLQQKRLIAKMEALRAQINPHFIANSLNAIESLVNLNKRKEASKYLVHFSRLSRRILNGSRQAFVSLSEEIETLEHFLALEQLRFRDKLNYDIQVQESLNLKLIQVPAMILQPYVENAIWHGIKPKEGAGLLKIIIEKDKKQLVCIIEDNGIGRIKAKALRKNSILKHKSQGMQISKERLEALGKMKGAKVQIIDLEDKDKNALGTRVILRLPLKLIK